MRNGDSTLYSVLKGVSYLVLLLMALAICYGSYISITQWSGISV